MKRLKIFIDRFANVIKRTIEQFKTFEFLVIFTIFILMAILFVETLNTMQLERTIELLEKENQKMLENSERLERLGYDAD